MVDALAAGVPVDGFTYGPVTPVAGFLMAMLGGALGLRCTVRALSIERSRRAGWLALGAVAIGAGIFTMHFIAMVGFTASGVPIGYDLTLSYTSLVIAVAVVGLGVFLVGFAGGSGLVLITGGLITGLGVAAMHYVGMASMQMPGRLQYDSAIVALSLLIAVVAATAALWFAVTVRGFRSAVAASLIMGIAVSGMHYTGMAALTVHAHNGTGGGGRSPVEILLPILIIPVLLLIFVALFVGLDPMTAEEMERGLRSAGRPSSGTAGEGEEYGEPAHDIRGGRR